MSVEQRTNQVADSFHEALIAAGQDWWDKPWLDWEDPIYVMRTRPGYVFDDPFWDVFHSFGFHVCHVSYYGPERREDATLDDKLKETGVFELRWVTREQALEAGRLAGPQNRTSECEDKDKRIVELEEQLHMSESVIYKYMKAYGLMEK